MLTLSYLFDVVPVCIKEHCHLLGCGELHVEVGMEISDHQSSLAQVV